MSFKKYKVELELDFDKRPRKKDILHRLFDVMKEDKVEYKLYKYNNRLYDFVKRSIKNDKYK